MFFGFVHPELLKGGFLRAFLLAVGWFQPTIFGGHIRFSGFSRRRISPTFFFGGVLIDLTHTFDGSIDPRHNIPYVEDTRCQAILPIHFRRLIDPRHIIPFMQDTRSQAETSIAKQTSCRQSACGTRRSIARPNWRVPISTSSSPLALT